MAVWKTKDIAELEKSLARTRQSLTLEICSISGGKSQERLLAVCASVPSRTDSIGSSKHHASHQEEPHTTRDRKY